MTKVMVVEDDQSLREIYSIRLTAEGYEIVSAGDGEEALALAVKEKPDLILSDVMMPKISGFDMLDILRQTPETKDIRVIMMTALSSDDQRKRGEGLGADKYLVKSQVGIEDVIAAVHEVLGEKATKQVGSGVAQEGGTVVDAVVPEAPAGGAEAIVPETLAGGADTVAPEVPVGGVGVVTLEVPAGGTEATQSVPTDGAENVAPEALAQLEMAAQNVVAQTPAVEVGTQSMAGTEQSIVGAEQPASADAGQLAVGVAPMMGAGQMTGTGQQMPQAAAGTEVTMPGVAPVPQMVTDANAGVAMPNMAQPAENITVAEAPVAQGGVPNVQPAQSVQPTVNPAQ